MFKMVCFALLVLLFCNSLGSNAKEIVELKVMNYNVKMLPIIEGQTNWDQDERLKRLPPAILKLENRPEVIFFNELMTSEADDVLKEELNVQFPFHTDVVGASCRPDHWDSVKGACSSDALVVRGGVMAISSLPIIRKHQYVFKNYEKHTYDKNANKGAIYIKVYKNGQFFHLVGTHLQADEEGYENQAQVVRVKQMQEIRTWLEDFSIPSWEPVIVLGDLNVEWGETSSSMIDSNLYKFDFKNNFGFGSFSPRTNWQAKADAFWWKYDLNYDKTLDYIMAMKNHKLPISPAWMEIYRLQSDDTWYWGYINRVFNIPGEGNVKKDGYYNDLSDHWPVAATYRFEYT